MQKQLTYQNLLSTFTLLVASGKISLKKLGLSAFAFEKIRTGQRILSADTAQECFELSEMSSKERPSKDTISQAVETERKERSERNAENQSQEVALKAFMKRDLLKEITAKDLVDNPLAYLLDPDNGKIDMDRVEDLKRMIEEFQKNKELDEQITLVFQGGGTKGAFQAGALLYIGQNWDALKIKDVVGASTGSFTALHVAAYGRDCGKKLAAHYTSVEDGDFKDWTSKYSKIQQVVSQSYFPSMLDDFLEAMMKAYPNRFVERSLKYELTAPSSIAGLPPAEVEYQVDVPEEGGGGEGVIPGVQSDDLRGYVKWGSIIGAGLLGLNAFPGVNTFISILGLFGLNWLEDKVEEFIKVLEAAEKLNENLLGLHHSTKIADAVEKTVGHLKAHPNDIQLHMAVTGMNDTRLHWVDENGDFTVDHPHQDLQPNLPLGQLAKGVEASMAFPFIFSPVALDLQNNETKIYADGGIRENCGIPKAYTLSGRQVVNINCAPSPLKRWPKGLEGDDMTVLFQLKTILLDINSHEGELAEQYPRLPFPRTKSLTRVQPGLGLIGLLEADTGCAAASMLVGFLYTQTGMYKQPEDRISVRGILKAMVARIEILLREMLMVERGMFFQGSVIAEEANHAQNKVVNINPASVWLPGDKDARYYFSYAKVAELRQIKKDILELLLEYCRTFQTATNLKLILPDHLGHLTMEDLLIRVSYPLAKSLWMPGGMREGEMFDYRYERPFPPSNLEESVLRKETITVGYSDLWGRFVNLSADQELVAAEEAPDLRELRSYEFDAMPLDPMPNKPILHQEVNDNIYRSDGQGGDLDRNTYHAGLPLIGPLHQKFIFWDPDGNYAVHDYLEAEGRLSENPISQGHWHSINGEHNSLIALKQDVVLDFNRQTGQYRVFKVHFRNVAAEGPLRAADHIKTGNSNRIFRGNQCLVKRPGSEQHLIGFRKGTRQFDVHGYSLNPQSDLFLANSLVFSGNFPQFIGLNDQIEFLNERVLVHKRYLMNRDQYQFVYYHVDIDAHYKSVVHYKPLFTSTVFMDNNFNNMMIAVLPLETEKALFLENNSYEIRESRFRFS